MHVCGHADVRLLVALHLVHQGRGSWLNREFALSASLASQLAVPCLHLLRAGFMGGQLCPRAVYVKSMYEDPISGPRTVQQTF